METQLNNRLLLVFVLGKLKSILSEDDTELQSAIKMSSVVLSKQILSIKVKEQLMGTPIPDHELFEKETLSKEDCLSNIEKFYNEIEADSCTQNYEKTEPSFSNMSLIMLKGSIKIIIDHLKVDL